MEREKRNTRARKAAAWALRWRRRHVSDNQFLLFISLLVGIFTACAGMLLKWLIGQIEELLTHEFVMTGSNWLYLVYPVVGIWLTMLFVRYVVRDDISHGVTKILFAIARKQSNIRSHNTFTSVIASAITIGFGGSVGAEAPIVLTGSAIGSTLGRIFRLSARQMMLLVGCGAAGAVAGIFKAPIAGLVFVLEVLMIDLTMTSLLPLLVSSVTAAALTFAVSGTTPLFEFHLHVLAHFQVEGGKGLVEEQHFGFVDDGTGYGNALLLSAGEGVYVAVFIVGHAHHAERLLHFLFDSGGGELLQLEAESNIIEYVEVGKQGVFLEHRVHRTPVGRCLRDVLSGNGYHSFRGCLKACNEA